MLRISRGVGRSDLAPLPPLSDAVSSRMMSLQSSMHSSQINTDGPAMSLRTSCWLLPQKEQYSSFSPEEVFSDMYLSVLPYGQGLSREVSTLSAIPYFTASSAPMKKSR